MTILIFLRKFNWWYSTIKIEAYFPLLHSNDSLAPSAMTMRPGGLHPEMDLHVPCHVPWLWYIELYYRGIQRKANRHGMNNNKVSSHDKHPLVCPLSRDDGDVALQWWCHTRCLCIHTQLAYHLHWWLLSVAYVRSLHLEKLLLLGVTWHLRVHLKFLVFGLVDAFYWSLIFLQLWHNIYILMC